MKFKALVATNLVNANVITLKKVFTWSHNKSPMNISQLKKLITPYLMYICYNFLYRFFIQVDNFNSMVNLS
jgi:hypothetical protein